MRSAKKEQNQVQEGVFADPEAGRMCGIPAGPAVVVVGIGLAGVVGVLVAGLAEHGPVAQIAEHVRAQRVGSAGLRVAVRPGAGAGALAAAADWGRGFEQVPGDQGLVAGLR